MIQYYQRRRKNFNLALAKKEKKKATEILATGHKQERNKVSMAFILDTPFPNLPNDLDP